MSPSRFNPNRFTCSARGAVTPSWVTMMGVAGLGTGRIMRYFAG
jgi:hypothetical protein